MVNRQTVWLKLPVRRRLQYAIVMLWKTLLFLPLNGHLKLQLNSVHGMVRDCGYIVFVSVFLTTKQHKIFHAKVLHVTVNCSLCKKRCALLYMKLGWIWKQANMYRMIKILNNLINSYCWVYSNPSFIMEEDVFTTGDKQAKNEEQNFLVGHIFVFYHTHDIL